MRMRRVGRIAAGLLAILAATAILYGGGDYAARRAGEEVAADANSRLEVYAASLNNSIEKFAHLPFTIAQNPDLTQLVAPGAVKVGDRNLGDVGADPVLRARVNHYLQTVSQAAGGSTLYVLRADGLTVASSNWNTPQSFVGMNFAFRPYFVEAMHGGQGRFYGVGTSTGVPGYFISAPIYDATAGAAARVLGVVAVKVSLDAVEASWKEASDKVMVADHNGVVFLASEPTWKFRALNPLSEPTRRYIAATHQYARPVLNVLDLRVDQMLAPGRPLVRLSMDASRRHYLVEQREIPPLHWKLMLLADAEPIAAAARVARIVCMLLMATLGILGLYLQLRHRRSRENLAARAALERAHLQLERKVAERTADLLTANRTLGAEVEQRIRTERVLRDAQSELVQAAKMAVLGQMAAGVTHELNQPLTAMRSLAENAGAFLAAGRPGPAADNLKLIAQLVERMGRITRQLRNFSRKSAGDAQPVDLEPVCADALALLEQRIASQHVRIVVSIGAGTRVMFDALRLQQVLVNLVRNALDALRAMPAGGRAEARADGQVDMTPTIRISALSDGEHVLLSVADNGPGITSLALRSLFDPFFTTKPIGEGLGLGLAISMAIARDYDATLEAENLPDGGACFMLRMRCAVPLAEASHA